MRAIDAVRTHSPDIVFLDVQMPRHQRLRRPQALVGQATCRSSFLSPPTTNMQLKAFDANALDYLLKPINDDRLSEALERARQARDEKLASSHREKLLKLVCEAHRARADRWKAPSRSL